MISLLLLYLFNFLLFYDLTVFLILIEGPPAPFPSFFFFGLIEFWFSLRWLSLNMPSIWTSGGGMFSKFCRGRALWRLGDNKVGVTRVSPPTVVGVWSRMLLLDLEVPGRPVLDVWSRPTSKVSLVFDRSISICYSVLLYLECYSELFNPLITSLFLSQYVSGLCRSFDISELFLSHRFLVELRCAVISANLVGLPWFT